MAVLFTGVLAIVFGVLQGALWYHGRNVALAAAQEGVAAARAYSAPRDLGSRAASEFLSNAGGATVLSESAVVDYRPTADQVRITVTGRTPSLFPWVPGPRVSESATGPVERFTQG